MYSVPVPQLKFKVVINKMFNVCMSYATMLLVVNLMT